MNTVIVTGANGFIGTELCKILNEKRVKAYVVLRSEASYTKELRELDNCIPIICDFHQIELLPSLIGESKVDVLFHLAWGGVSGSARGDYKLQISNIERTLDLIMAVSKIQCKRFVGVGSTAEYDVSKACHKDGLSPNIVSHYGAAKISVHYMSKVLCNSLGIQHEWAYLGNTYGYGDKGNNFINFAIRQILSSEDAKFTSGEQYYDFVYVTDIAQGLYCIGEKGKDKYAYYVGSGEPRELREYIIKLRDMLNPSKELKLGAISYNGVSSDLSDFDIQKIKMDTGYEAKVRFEEGVRKTIEWIKEVG